MHSTMDAGVRMNDFADFEQLLEAPQVIADLLRRQPFQQPAERGAQHSLRLVLELYPHLPPSAARCIEEMDSATARDCAVVERSPFDAFVRPVQDDLGLPFERAFAQ